MKLVSLQTIAITLLFLLSMTAVLAANDPGHDSLYVLRLGDTNITGSINLTGNVTAQLVRVSSRFFGDNLDIRADGSATTAQNFIKGTATDLEIGSASKIILNGGGTTVQVGTVAAPANLNVTGSIFEGNVRVCLANGTNCPGGSNTGNVSSITAGNGISVDQATGDVTISTSATTCAITEYSYWDGDSWECRADQNSGGTGNITGAGNAASSFAFWSNATHLTNSSALREDVGNQRIIVNGTLRVSNGSFASPSIEFNDADTGFFRGTDGRIEAVVNGLTGLQIYEDKMYVYRGSASAPGIAWNDASTTGIFGPNDTSIGFSIGTVEVARIDEYGMTVNGTIVVDSSYDVCISGGNCLSGGPGGGVSGPGSSTLGSVARFNTIAGDSITDSAVTIDDNGNLGGVGNITTSSNFFIGNSASASNTSALAIGEFATADGEYGVALGWGAWAKSGGSNAAAIGSSTVADGDFALALGGGSSATGHGAVALGYAMVNGMHSIGIGDTAIANATNTTAIGPNATATQVSAIAIGSRAQALHNNSIALGRDTATTTINQFMVGSSSYNLNTQIFGTFNTSGTITQNDVAVCLSNGTNCPAGTTYTNGTGITLANNQFNLSTAYTDTLYARGAASSTDNAIARYDSTTGKVLQNSAVTVDDSGNLAGVGNISTGTNFWIGSGASAGATNAIAIGASAEASNDSAIAIGDLAKANGTTAFALGPGTTASGGSSTAIGYLAEATSNYAIAVGYDSSATGENGAAFGHSATASGSTSTAIGEGAQATNTGSIALGAAASASHALSIAIGPYATTTAANQLVIGNLSYNLNTQVFGTLNTTGNLYENNARVCTAANGQCPSSADGTGGWLNTSAQVYLYSNTTNVSIGSGPTFFVDNTNGRAGIGTASPTHTLHVAASIPRIRLERTSATGPGYWDFAMTHAGASNYGSLYLFPNETTGDFVIANSSVSPKFYVDTSSGNVGIGTASPTHLLHVNGSGGINITQGGGASRPAIHLVPDNNDAWQILPDSNGLSIYDTTDEAAYLTVDQTGKVGIGNNTPASTLHIYSGASNQTPFSGTQLTLEDNAVNYLTFLAPNTTAPGIVWGDQQNNDQGSIRYNHVTDTITFETNDTTDRVVINGLGNVGIGTTTPTQNLDVNGSIRADSGITPNMVRDPMFGDMEAWFSEADNAQVPVQLPTGEYVTGMEINGSTNRMILSHYITVDPEKTYRFRIWMKTNDTTTGNHYFGLYCYDSTKTQTNCTTSAGADTNNPYFWIGDVGVANTFMPLTGYLFPAGTTSWTNPPDTTSTNFAMGSDVVYVRLRFLHYPGAAATVSSTFAMPSIEELNEGGIWNLRTTMTDNYVILNPAYNVGIGTAAPKQKLDVNGSINVSGTGATIYVNNTQVCLSDGKNCPANSATSSAAGWQNTSTLVSLVDTADNVTIDTVHFDNTNNRVGVGTTSPQRTLHVSSGAASTPGEITLTSLGTSANAEMGALWFGTSEGSAWNATGIKGISDRLDFNANDWPSALIFLTTPDGSGTATERVRIDRDGNVGIGTSSPETKLHVSASSTGVVGTIIENTGSGDNSSASLILDNIYNWSLSVAQGQGDKLLFSSGTAGSNVLALDTSGKIGIGTIAPATPLDIDTASNTAGVRIRGLAETAEIADIYVGSTGQLIIDTTPGTDTQSFIELRSEDNEYGLILRESDGTGVTSYANFYVTDAADDYLGISVVNTSANPTMVLTNGGKVGIGILSPGAKLHVNQSTASATTARFENSAGNNSILLRSGSGADNYIDYDAGALGNNLYFRPVGGGSGAMIDINGGIHFGALAAPSNNPVCYTTGIYTGFFSFSTCNDIYLLNTGDTATGNYTFDTTTFHIDSTNNRIGIGTASPTYPLTVIGAINATTTINATTYYGAGTGLTGTAASLTVGDLSCTNCIGGTEIDESTLSGVNAGTLDSIDSASFLRSDAADTATGKIEFTGSSIGATYGIDGRYTDNSSAAYAGSIWALDSAYMGGIAGPNATVPTYGLAWVRGTHMNASASIGEGIYLYQASTLRGGIGSSGIYTSGTVTANSFSGAGTGLTGTAASLTVGDLSCTDCIGATEISDVYMLNTGDTITGLLRAGSGGTPGYASASGDIFAEDDIEYDGDLYGPGADLAELIHANGELEAGDVVVADEANAETVKRSSTAYNTAVVGVISSDPGIILSKNTGDVPLALSGRVPIKASAENGPIRPGDLLTTSSTAGHAMRCESREACQGAIVAKSLGTLESGTGTITGLVMLG